MGQILAEVTYLICAVQRTGSLLLCEALKDTGIAGRPPGNLFRLVVDQSAHLPKTADIVASVEATRTSNGVCGERMFWNGWGALLECLRQGQNSRSNLSDVDVLSRYFGDLRFIWLRREDKLRQAISFWRATHPKEQFRHPTDPLVPINVPEFDYDEIESFERLVSDQEVAWRNWFETNEVEAFEVVYEQFAADRNVGVQSILVDFLQVGLPHRSLQPSMIHRQADIHTERYLELFKEERVRRGN